MACFKYVIYQAGWVSQAIFYTINSVLFLCSAIGNSLVIYLVWRKSDLRTPTYLLMSFLVMSDLLTSFLGQLPIAILYATAQEVSCGMISFIAFMHASSGISSLLLLALISRDRYLHASKRQQYPNYTSNRFAITASISSYLFGMTMAIVFMFQNRTLRILSLATGAVIGIFSFAFICFKSRKIIRIVQDHNKQMELDCKDEFDQSAFIRSKCCEKSVNKSIFSIIAVFFASWTPIIILMTIYAMHNFLNKPIADGYRIATLWAAITSYLNGALNPIIYSYRCDAIGREIGRIAGKIARRRTTAPSTMRIEVQGNTSAPKI